MKPRTLLKLLAGFLALAAMADSCSPSVTVQNNTSFEVRASVYSAGHHVTVSPSPGESSYAEVGSGPYVVTIIPNQEWLDHARATREFLDKQLANPENLTPDQTLEVVRRLKDI